jgi:hypothetical protein
MKHISAMNSFNINFCFFYYNFNEKTNLEKNKMTLQKELNILIVGDK